MIEKNNSNAILFGGIAVLLTFVLIKNAPNYVVIIMINIITKIRRLQECLIRTD